MTEKPKLAAEHKLLYTANEACEALAVSRYTLNCLVNKGLLKPHRGLSTLRFAKTELESYVAMGMGIGAQLAKQLLWK